MADILKTPLSERHAALGARMAPFAGWEMPIQYEGILKEHHWTRSEASIFDTCHMGEFELSGPTAEPDLERLLTCRIETIGEGRCRYGYLLNESGGVLDDLTCYRVGADRFFLVVNAGTKEKDKAWILSHLSSETTFLDHSESWGKLDVQGPASRQILEEIIGRPLPGLKYFGFSDFDLKGIPCTLSRTGYTGEWGYELYLPWNKTAEAWDILTQNSRIKPAGLGARDTLRLEVGYPLYGHELTAERTPVAAASKSFMYLEKEFIGKSAVMKDLDEGTSHRMVGLLLEGKRAARAEDQVFLGDEEIGVVTSGSLGPSLDQAVAMAYVHADNTALQTTLAIDVRGKKLPCRIVDLPFYQNGTARKNP